MSESSSPPVNGRRIGRWCWIAITALGLGLTGCHSVNLRGEEFPEQENELSNFCGKYRSSDGSTGPAAFCNKAKQIESNLGVR